MSVGARTKKLCGKYAAAARVQFTAAATSVDYIS